MRGTSTTMRLVTGSERRSPRTGRRVRSPKPDVSACCRIPPIRRYRRHRRGAGAAEAVLRLRTSAGPGRRNAGEIVTSGHPSGAVFCPLSATLKSGSRFMQPDAYRHVSGRRRAAGPIPAGFGPLGAAADVRKYSVPNPGRQPISAAGAGSGSAKRAKHRSSKTKRACSIVRYRRADYGIHPVVNVTRRARRFS